jgi:hypothetical protein
VTSRPLPTVLDKIQAGWPARTPTRLTRFGATATLGLLLSSQAWHAPPGWLLLAMSRGGDGDEQ